jgi:hypothetical protein
MASKSCHASKKRGRYREYLFDVTKMPSKLRREVEVLIAEGNETGPSSASQEVEINLLDWIGDSDSDDSDVEEAEIC